MSTLDVPVGPSGSRRYPRAPIVEAVLEMRVTTSPDLPLEALGGVKAAGNGYSIRTPFNEVVGEFNVQQDSVATQARQAQTGYVWRTPDDARHFQSRRDAFLYLQRAPYDQWSGFVSEAEHLWLLYKEIAQPLSLNRMGARFINRIDIPSPGIDLQQYFRTTVEVSADLPQVVAGYFFQVQLPQVRGGVGCTIISAIAPPPNPETTSVMLDIDAWCEPNLEPSRSSFDEDVRHWLRELRHAKNDVFEACITDDTRRLFL